MTYKMIVLDLDDTLLRDDLTISPRTKQSLMEAQEAGVKVVLASGRPTQAMLPIADELRLKEYGSFILSFNGGKIINCQTGEEWFSSTLPIATPRPANWIIDRSLPLSPIAITSSRLMPSC